MMETIQARTVRVSSNVLRILTYFYLRWVIFPFGSQFLFTVFAIYVSSFFAACLKDPKYELVDTVDVKVTETILEDVPVGEGQPNGDQPNGDQPAVAEDGAPVMVAEKVEIQEAISVQERDTGLLRTLLTGVPNPRSFLQSALTFLVNLLAVGFVVDRVYHERAYTGDHLSFIRLGHVSDSEAKFLIREPDQSKMPVRIELRIKDPQAPFDNPLWQTAGGLHRTTNETDFTGVVTVPLRHSKQRTYEWSSSNNHSGQFTAPPKVGQVSASPSGNFTFLSTSCLVNRVPYSPFDHPLSITGLRQLAKVLPDLGAQFMLFLGDFIYADVPRVWGTSVEEYRRKYRRVYASPEWPSVGQNLSWIHVLDDHEIRNDWDANTTGVYAAAVDPWRHYHVAANPSQARRAGAASFTDRGPNVTWFEFAQGPASFFMLDTRRYRSSNKVPWTDADKTMLGTEQREDLLAFLRRPEPKGVRWKFVASSVPFTKNWRVNSRDTWGGFLAERRKVLEAMWDAAARGYGVVVLSGDRHEFASTKFPPPKPKQQKRSENDQGLSEDEEEAVPTGPSWPETATVYEFSASPLSQFYSPISTYFQTDDEDVKIKYIRSGNSKFGAVTIESLEQGNQSSLKYRLFVDGKEAWNTVVLAPPAAVEQTPSSLWSRLLG